MMSQAVNQMFAGIAQHYDRLNNILSFGMHHHWRRYAVSRTHLQPGARVLDLCSGTADFALAFARNLGREGCVIATDFCPPMLIHGMRKAKRLLVPIDFALADAQHLPFPDASFDCVSVAFGLRNVTCLKTALCEMYRVLRPGGTAVILEFGQPQGVLCGPLYRLYSRQVMPRVGGWLSGDRNAYTYLPTTAAAFPAGQKFSRIMTQQAFQEVSAEPLLGGIVYLYTAMRST